MSRRWCHCVVGILLGAFALGNSAAYAQTSARRVGVGVAIGHVYDLFATTAINTTEDVAAMPAILVPVNVTPWLRLEGEIGVFRHTHQEPSTYSLNSLEAGLGVFPQWLDQNFRLYYGARFGYVTRKEKETGRTQTIDGFYVAPAVGGEYLLSERFGVGAEAQFRHTSVKGDDVFERRLPPFIPPERRELSVSATRVLLISRFYF